jgi:hypothetical protein
MTRRSRFGADAEDVLAGTHFTAPDPKRGQVATVAMRPHLANAVAERLKKKPAARKVRPGDSLVAARRALKAQTPKPTPPPPKPEPAPRLQRPPAHYAAPSSTTPATKRIHYSLRQDAIDFAEEQFRTGRRPDGSRWRSASQYIESLIMLAKERAR